MERETYRDCMRNHAATLGTYATDGCGEYTPNPSSTGGMQCAACGCHRNFHRKVPVESSDANNLVVQLAHSPSSTAEGRTMSDGTRRRTRTKFSNEQKEKMLMFSEKIGWRIPRRDETVDRVGMFCREIGISRQIFKVWMHNHKNDNSSSSSAAAVAGGDADGGDDVHKSKPNASV
ncbi:hypothetical protein ZOSMA_49G00520 [Zostera marina]|uniref:ZF-HD dimerization-type domain-containing protein n=1 Tax=Zostera marina TaxID=29655 RepID=A0A0K9NZ30_ZOSMR|nr:hypothetical protein ZOSMA_49G00520 [Zostera marina]